MPTNAIDKTEFSKMV